jgi:hypothetical protein
MRIKGRRSRVLSSHRWDNDPDILARTCRNRRQEIFATANFSGGPGWDRELSAPNVSLRVLPSGNYQKKSHTDTIDGFPIGVNDHAVLHQSPLCHGRITKPRYVNASYFFFFLLQDGSDCLNRQTTVQRGTISRHKIPNNGRLFPAIQSRT